MTIMPDANLAALALTRFGLGPKPGEIKEAAADPRGYLLQAVARKSTPMPASPDLLDSAAALVALRAFEMERKAERAANPAKTGDTAAALTAGRDQAMRSAPVPVRPKSGFGEMSVMQAAPATQAVAAPAAPAAHSPAGGAMAMSGPPLPQRIYRDEAEARAAFGVSTPDGFAERLVWFWSNHFAVSVAKGPGLRVTAGAFEREAIRPHIFGRFADMLRAVEQHPAMLIYLDNRQSLGPNSRAGMRRGRGLNENLAREILELHTLGVDGGYTQADVTSFAKAITGWSIAGPEGRLGAPGTFVFNPFWHEPGDQTILGKVYREGGIEQGEAVLADLARHPATARHIATKFARHFVADDPPPALVARLVKTFRDTDGDLAALAQALIAAPEAWNPTPAKIRSPQEFAMATMRLFGRTPPAPAIVGSLAALGQPLWAPGGPNGYADTLAQWASPEGMKTRLDFAAQVGRRAVLVDPVDLLDTAFHDTVSSETRHAVARAESRPQAIALLLMSPEFQRR